MNYSRLLTNKDSVRHFFERVLQYDYETECSRSILSKVAEGEKGLLSFDERSQTLNSTAERGNEYYDNISRWRLRKKIISELFSLKRLSNDDDISLGMGGALPQSELKADKQAIIIIGLPASGKSTIATTIADDYGAVIIDSDYAKRKIPEFHENTYGATVVHEESSEITFGFSSNDGNLKSLYEKCLDESYNMVIPTIGHSPRGLLELAKKLKTDKKYDVHLISIELLKKDATIRAIKRFDITGRYVPLGLIFDQYGNNSILSYYYLRCKYFNEFKSFGALYNNVPQGQDPKCTDILGGSPIIKYEIGKNIVLF
ncbi:hypothetical protein FACS189451_03380 [Bacteroidia bacterium]|nr:hypothetical protein FACS189451_03380 [Bacteroidia bacterium]